MLDCMKSLNNWEKIGDMAMETENVQLQFETNYMMKSSGSLENFKSLLDKLNSQEGMQIENCFIHHANALYNFAQQSL